MWAGGVIPPSHSMIFFKTPSWKPMPYMPPPPIKNEAPLNWKTKTPTLTNEATSRKWFLEKNSKKSETAINTCVSLIKQNWWQITEIPKKHNFLIWSIENFVRKVKEFARKYYITWLINLAKKLYDI